MKISQRQVLSGAANHKNQHSRDVSGLRANPKRNPEPAQTQNTLGQLNQELTHGRRVAIEPDMRRLLFALLLLMAPLAWAENSYSARVIRVIDGDTLVIEATGRVLKVRLFGVDCPEMSQPGGEHAAWFTGNMVAGKMVEVAEHDTDRYGRTVAEIILPDNRDLNKELVKHGEAWWYAEFDRDDAEMQQLEARARERRIGLWVESNPLPPWEWRKAARGMRSSSLRARVRSVSYQER